MECEKCGADVAEGVDTCPDCGEPLSNTILGAEDSSAVAAPFEAAEVDGFERDAAPGSDAPSGDVPPAAPAGPIIAADAGGSGGGKKLLWVAIALLIVALLAGGGWFVYSRMQTGASPDAAAVKMLNAYAEYDAAGILDSATHKTLPADGVKEFETQAADAKKRANGKPGVKNIKVVSTKLDKETQATVVVSAEWLTDPVKGTYEKREETLTVVKEDGKWLVKLF